MLMNLVKLRFA